jgi:hypothetical protein
MSKTEAEIWKSRAEAHEADYKEMLKRVDSLVAENKLWQQEANNWRKMYLEYDEMLEADLEKATSQIETITDEIRKMKKQIGKDTESWKKA